MPSSQSPLDQPKVRNFILKQIEKGKSPSEICGLVEDKHGVTTTTDSLRRFRQRHFKGKQEIKPLSELPDTNSSTPKKPEKPPFRYSLMEDDDEKCITVFFPGETPYVATTEHPSFTAIEKAAQAGDPKVKDLFDVEATLNEKLSTQYEKVSDRISVRNGKVYFDNDEQNDALAEHLIRCLEDEVEDYEPVILFMERLYTNPNEHSRTQLWGWLKRQRFTITEDGLILGYKGVRKGSDGGYHSVNDGTAIVDGEEITGQIPNPIGAIVEMPRSQVQHDPRNGCSTGLHVGTWNYASTFGSYTLEVHVDPRDVVSVPTDSGEQKLRTCRYEVIREVTKPYEQPIASSYEDDDDELEEETYCERKGHCDCYNHGELCCECGEAR